MRVNLDNPPIWLKLILVIGGILIILWAAFVDWGDTVLDLFR